MGRIHSIICCVLQVECTVIARDQAGEAWHTYLQKDLITEVKTVYSPSNGQWTIGHLIAKNARIGLASQFSLKLTAPPVAGIFQLNIKVRKCPPGGDVLSCSADDIDRPFSITVTDRPDNTSLLACPPTAARSLMTTCRIHPRKAGQPIITRAEEFTLGVRQVRSPLPCSPIPALMC